MEKYKKINEKPCWAFVLWLSFTMVVSQFTTNTVCFRGSCASFLIFLWLSSIIPDSGKSWTMTYSILIFINLPAVVSVRFSSSWKQQLQLRQPECYFFNPAQQLLVTLVRQTSSFMRFFLVTFLIFPVYYFSIVSPASLAFLVWPDTVVRSVMSLKLLSATLIALVRVEPPCSTSN